jgi:hypothetical protein
MYSGYRFVLQYSQTSPTSAVGAVALAADMNAEAQGIYLHLLFDAVLESNATLSSLVEGRNSEFVLRHSISDRFTVTRSNYQETMAKGNVIYSAGDPFILIGQST